MGINAELVCQVARMRSDFTLLGDSVIEIGAQDVCVAPNIIARVLAEYSIRPADEEILDARQLYNLLGFSHYKCIDASGVNGALLFDLNNDIKEEYGFCDKYDLVTNLGTAEHCFNQFSVFKNLHDLCRAGGVIVNALPSQGNVNHGFYNYHPRFFVDLAVANGYEIVELAFTVDYKSTLIKYTKSEYKKWDSHDLLFYSVFRKINDDPFRTPFDGMFSKTNRVAGYIDCESDPLHTEFSPYLKGGNWENTKGYEVGKKSIASRLASYLARRSR